MLTLALGFAFTGEGFLQVFNKTTSETAFYFISTGAYKDMQLARAEAELIQSRGGAGYVMKRDDVIEIVVAVYPSREAAESALKKFNDKTAVVKEIKWKNNSLKWVDKSKKENVSNALQYFDLVFNELFCVSNKMNTKEISATDAKIKIDVLITQIQERKAIFYKAFENDENQRITEIKLALITTLALLDNIIYSGGTNNVISSIRYQAVQLVNCHQALMNSIS